MTHQPIPITHPYSAERIYAHRDRLEALKTGAITPPITVDIDLTDACDHRCPWCEYAKFRIKNPKHLPLEMALKLLDDLSDTPVKGIIFSGGGEPTVYPYFKDVTRKIQENSLLASLYTHGGHIHRFLDEISAAFSHVRVSLDAGSASTHAMYHTPEDFESFELVFQNLQMLKMLNPKLRVEVSLLLAEYNITEISQLREALLSVPVDFLLVKFSRFKEHNVWVTAEILKLIEHELSVLREIVNVYYRPPLPEAVGRYPVHACRTHYLKTLVAPDGKLYVCNQWRGNSSKMLGSLFEDPFWEIWNRTFHRLVASMIDTHLCPPCRHVAYNSLLDAVQDSEIPEVSVDESVGSLVNIL